MRPELALVRWRDAWFDFDEPDPEERREDYIVETVGFLIGEDDRFIHLAQELLPLTDGFRAVTHIPIAVVVGPVTKLGETPGWRSVGGQVVGTEPDSEPPVSTGGSQDVRDLISRNAPT